MSERFSRMGPVVFAPAAMSRRIGGSRPQFGSSGRGRVTGSKTGIHVSHTEYLMNVTTTGTGFASAQYPINPGVPTLFPWLSLVASRFNRYRFNRLEFTYSDRCSSQSVGCVMIAVDSDASDALPVSQPEVESLEMVADDVPWKPISLRCNTQDLNASMPFHFVRVGVPSGTVDIKTYDSGNFILATTGIPAGTYGEIHVTYDVDLESAILSDYVGGFLTGVTALTSGLPLGTPAGITATGILPGTWSTTTFTFSQQFEGTFTVTCDGSPGAFIFGGTCTWLLLNTSPAAGATVMASVAVRASLGQTLALGYSANPGGGAVASIFIAPCPYDAL
jgi:hypothetical protein